MKSRIFFIVSAAVCCNAGDMLKIFNWCGWNESALDYYGKLGYTHVLVPLESAPESYSHATGAWVYNGGEYSSGRIAERLRALKRAAEKRGLTPIPILASLSHVDEFIALDNTLSEHERTLSEINSTYRKPSMEMLLKSHPCTGKWNSKSRNKYSDYDKIAAAGKLGENKAADEFFAEQLKIIASVWADTLPAYLHIGHDEIGFKCVGFIKIGRNRSRSESAAQLLAMEVDARILQIDSIINQSVRVLIWGDSFVRSDHGETYQLAGDISGNGGALKILDEKYGRRERLIVMPWTFSIPDDAFEGNSRNLTFDKTVQIAYLDRLGYAYIPTAGEDGVLSEDARYLENIKRVAFEWVNASRKYPLHLAGFCHATWLEFSKIITIGQTQIQVGYSAPMLAYLGWTCKDRRCGPACSDVYNPEIFSRVDFIKSRQELDWKENIHYRLPESCGQRETEIK